MMRSILLSAVLGMATLTAFFGTASTAEAQRWRGRGYYDRDYWDGRYYGSDYYSRPYYRSYYYGRPYYGTSYYYSTPSTSVSYYYGPNTTYSDDSRYHYYWSNGWYICYDRQTGDYWYQDPNTRYWYRWR
jgi:hypothetical protein